MELNRDKIKTVSNSSEDNKALIEAFEYNSIFKKDKNVFFIYQKIKKLASAIFVITNYFDDNEPIKWSIRDLSARLLRQSISLSKNSSQVNFVAQTDAEESVLELISLLEVASFAGLVSSMNFSILQREIGDLLEKIGAVIENNKQSGFSENSNFFKIDEPTDNPNIIGKERNFFNNNLSHDLLKDNNNVLYKGHLSEGDNRLGHQDSDTNLKAKLHNFSPVVVKKNKRQSSIINLLKRKKEVMIKDVSSIISDCSEKTIQRELLALVEGGILKKEGERRWTRYSLA
jgi:hypothetical protein